MGGHLAGDVASTLVSNYIIEHFFDHSPFIDDESIHAWISSLLLTANDLLNKESNLNKVVLSGGVCQNITLLDLIYKELQDRYDIYINEKVPSNDGGIALGQMAVALTRYLQMR